jgi:hypothetical protein
VGPWVVVHLPHILPALVAFASLARLARWAAAQPPEHYSEEEIAEWRAAREATMVVAAPVDHRIAGLGTLALLPLVAAVVTGLADYTWALRNDRPSSILVWTHVAVSVAALALVTAKTIVLGPARLRPRLDLARVREGWSSIALLALGAPLALTGLWLLAAPSGTSRLAYAHLIVGVWWTLLLQWHLWRYFTRAVRAVVRGSV